MRDFPKDVLAAAHRELQHANAMARLDGQPMDPIECIGTAIMSERDRAVEVVENLIRDSLTQDRNPMMVLKDALAAIRGDAK